MEKVKKERVAARAERKRVERKIEEDKKEKQSRHEAELERRADLKVQEEKREVARQALLTQALEEFQEEDSAKFGTGN